MLDFVRRFFVSCAQIFEAYSVRTLMKFGCGWRKISHESKRKKAYQEVAEAWSKYQPVSEEYGFKNSSCECNTPSCLNCTHFTNQEHCDLDLYDQIVERIK